MAAATPDTSQFGNLIQGLQQLSSLFGDKQSREQSQQFSTQQVGDQAIAANTAATQAGLSSLGLQKEGAMFGAALNQQGYQNKSNTDLSQAAQLKSLNQGGGAIAGYSDFFNNYDPVIKGSPYAPRVESVQRQNPEAVKMAYQNRLQQDAANADFQRNIAQSDRDRYNQALLSQQQATQQLNAQSGQLAAQKDIAATQAQGNIISSLFGSVGIGANQNRKYWN